MAHPAVMAVVVAFLQTPEGQATLKLTEAIVKPIIQQSLDIPASFLSPNGIQVFGLPTTRSRK